MRQEAEWSNRVSINFLKKHGYLPKDGGWRSGVLTWSYGLSENKSSVGFDINIGQGENYIRLHYTHTSRWDGAKNDMDFRVQLTTTPCNYGGERYWFICPLSRNGMYCGRRVGVLFCIGKWFGCRHCGEIVYAAQMKGGKFRGSSVTYPDIDKLEKEVKRYYYNGKPTRKYRRLMKMENKLNYDLFKLVGSLDKNFARFNKKG